MHALRLTTRFFDDDNVAADACLLSYDVDVLTSVLLADDIRDQFNARPTTKRIYILAPFIAIEVVKAAMLSGSVFERVRNYFRFNGGEIYLLSSAIVDLKIESVAVRFNLDTAAVSEDAPVKLHASLINGWLFDLFDKNKGLAAAPSGVHFGKGSKKHSAQFLRTSEILLSSTACAIVAYFTLATTTSKPPRRIFVDTAPLISVAFAMQKIAMVSGHWTMHVPILSFSSYGGLERLPRASPRDLVLVSASTSGGLIDTLGSRGFDIARTAILFFLSSNVNSEIRYPTVCDLTFRQGNLYGYASVENYAAGKCPLCEKGYFLATLEGDQFSLGSRPVKELLIRSVTQPVEARKTIEALARHQAIKIQLFPATNQGADLLFDVKKAMDSSPVIKENLLKILRRFVPFPLRYIILVDFAESDFVSLITEAGLSGMIEGASFINDSELRGTTAVVGAGVLVFIGCLKQYSRIRDINAELRVVADRGCIAYLTAVTLAESPEHLAGLRGFLTYGALGRDSFTFVSAYTLMYPFTHDERSSWELELELLRRLVDDGDVEDEIPARLQILQGNDSNHADIFWRGKEINLSLNNDFVFLNTEVDRDLISQADVFATISNLVACARAGNRSITSNVIENPIRWQQSVYGHTLLSVQNFEDFNDAVLRAALLRVATSAELHYANHEESSARMLVVIRQGISGWTDGLGDFIPEILISLATNRLVLSPSDIILLKQDIIRSTLPKFLKDISRVL